MPVLPRAMCVGKTRIAVRKVPSGQVFDGFGWFWSFLVLKSSMLGFKLNHFEWIVRIDNQRNSFEQRFLRAAFDSGSTYPRCPQFMRHRCIACAGGTLGDSTGLIRTHCCLAKQHQLAAWQVGFYSSRYSQRASNQDACRCLPMLVFQVMKSGYVLCSFVPHSPSILFEGVTTAWDHWRSLSGNTLPGFKLPETELLCVSRLKARIGQKQPHEPHCGIFFKCSSVGS